MKKFDSIFEQKLTNTIAEIEEKTSAEVVVAIAPSSDKYIDTYLKGGIIILFVLLLFILYSPFLFLENMVLLELSLGFVLGVMAVWSSPPIKRLLISKKRKEHYVKNEAYRFFFDNSLTSTIERSAFLVYVSIFERKVKLVLDKGIKDAIPLGVLKEIEADFADIYSFETSLAQSILDTLLTLTEPFSKFLPPSEDNLNEIPNNLNKL